MSVPFLGLAVSSPVNLRVFSSEGRATTSFTLSFEVQLHLAALSLHELMTAPSWTEKLNQQGSAIFVI